MPLPKTLPPRTAKRPRPRWHRPTSPRSSPRAASCPTRRCGPYRIDRFHANVFGVGHGFCDGGEGRMKWEDQNKARMAEQTSRGDIDWDSAEAPDPDYAFAYGRINGRGVDMRQMRPAIIKAQQEMKATYNGAWAKAQAKPGATAAFEQISKLPEENGKVCQPGGKELTILGLFEGALGAIGALWEYGLEVRKASGEPDAGLSWGIKKTQCARGAQTLPHIATPRGSPRGCPTLCGGCPFGGGARASASGTSSRPSTTATSGR